MGGCASKAIANSDSSLNESRHDHLPTVGTSVSGNGGGGIAAETQSARSITTTSTAATAVAGRRPSGEFKKKNSNGSIPNFLKPSIPKVPKSNNSTYSAVSSNGTTVPKNISYVERGSDPRWTALYDQYSAHIIDPADVHSVLSEHISSTIDRLNPAEVTFIQRRVRRVVHEILANVPNGGSGPTGVSNIVGRLVGSSASVDDDDGRSRDAFKKDKVLDEQLVRRIFAGAEMTLRRGAQQNIVSKTKQLYEQRKDDNLIHGSPPELPSGTSIDRGHTRTPTPNIEHTSSSHSLQSLEKNKTAATATITRPVPVPYNSMAENGDKDTTHPSRQKIYANGVKKRGSFKQTQHHTMPQSQPFSTTTHGSLADPIGAAYILMLYLAESRWDHFATLAKLSALQAGLDMDVNKTEKKSPNTNNTKSSGLVPAPAPRIPQEDGYGEELHFEVPTLPAGASFPALCFIIAMAIRGTRRQKLNLLFYLLLPLNDLNTLLLSHPGGGVPSWLIESDTETILSYASLAHYHHYSAVMQPQPSVEAPDDPMKTLRLKLNLNPQRAIGTILTLLTDAMRLSSANGLGLEFSGRNTASTSAVGKDKWQPPQSPNGILVGNDRPIGKVHSLLTHYLADAGEGRLNYGEADATDARAKAQSLYKFWDGSHSAYTVSQKQHWNQLDFVAWADVVLDDAALDNIMERLFCTGILPTPEMEQELVRKSWTNWEKSDLQFWLNTSKSDENSSFVTKNVHNFFSSNNGAHDLTKSLSGSSHVWGGIGGVDGRGALGFGIMYCIDKTWWEEWERYSCWKWSVNGGLERDFFDVSEDSSVVSRKRPGELSTEHLLDRSSNDFVAGSLGAYEIMKPNLKKDEDYILVPTEVWDILYEIYGGGPPLPRMVLPPANDQSVQNNKESSEPKNMKPVEDAKVGPKRIPLGLNVDTHPWILHCHVCDPYQPYRRGDAGPMSIRIMAHPDQPLWKVFAEAVIRLPVLQLKGRDDSGSGRARLWKRLEATVPSKFNLSGGYRYGPWSLLCKNRDAKFPVGDRNSSLATYKESWHTYADNESVESVGLADGARLMFEYAMLNRDGTFAWPREAAAKFGRARRVADEDTAFRQMLKGLDTSGKLVRNPSTLKGTTIDAMDSSGRWYQAEITQIDTNSHPDNETDRDESSEAKDNNGNVKEDDDDDDDENEGSLSDEIKAVCLDFREHGGHEEWIDVKSDRLAVKGRFTSDSLKTMDTESTENDNGKDQASVDSKSSKSRKKESNLRDASVDQSSSAVCAFPGYGACGLSNLGNTCYANSALQCISYMPMVRSYLLSDQFRVNGDLNKDNPLGTGGKLLEEFVDLLKLMWSGKHGSRYPRNFRTQLAKARSQYAGADQQDAQELLNDALDALHEDSNRVKKKPYVEALEDDWVKDTPLPRVGMEAWRRFLRRNRSVVADIAMGQVLNRVTCPVCNHCSRNFDPFNMLSIPFPTVAEVIFQCKVIRRGTSNNCPGTLGRLTKSCQGEKSENSESFVFEEYIIAMSRLADIGDLKHRLQTISGIAPGRLKLCRAEEIVVNADEENSSPTRTYTKVTMLPDKDGPCVQLAKPSQSTADLSSPAPTHIVAFESTLSPRPPGFLKSRNNAAKGQGKANIDETDREGDNSVVKENVEEEEEPNSREQKSGQQKFVQQLLQLYGNDEECRVYDTNPISLSKAMSRRLWPESATDFRLGLRVDAIDQRNNWFPGSVVEIIEGPQEEDNGGKKFDRSPPNIKVRIHFDNFSSKWDETYPIEKFKDGKVQPLYSHAPPKPKPTEFLVHHRRSNKTNKGNSLFGQPFYLQCHGEWSTARAGAQILAQASRFLEPPSEYKGITESRNIPRADLGLRGNDGANNDSDSSGFHHSASMTETDIELYKSTEDARALISQTIDLLLEYDRRYVDSVLMTENPRPTPFIETERRIGQKRHSEDGVTVGFNPSVMSSKLNRKLDKLLPKFPFDVRVCTADSPLGGRQGSSSDEVPFPFSLVRTIGNYMNARHAVVLHWKERKLENNSSLRLYHYISPTVGVHKESKALLGDKNDNDESTKKSGKTNGIHLGVCLTEFCKEQQLPESDNWRCPKCKEVREGKQSMTLWRLPDILTFHLKRFNCSARWREKITTKVNFPLTGLNMSEWCDKESPANQGTDDYVVYDLIGVVNHYGGMTGGHYVATCKATACTPDGSEEVAHNFTGAGIRAFDAEEETVRGGWRLTRSREKDAVTAQTKAASLASKMVGVSAEPLWLQFDDDLVEPIPPRNVVSEMAYVLFYRRRRVSPSNIAKYSTLE